MAFLLALLIVLAPAAHARTPDAEVLLSREVLYGLPRDAMRLGDAHLFHDSYAQGGDLIEHFVRLIFPVTGRERRTMFLPLGYWGPKKPQYRKLDWYLTESDRFRFVTYPKADSVFSLVVGFFEEDFERNNRIFAVDNRFLKKIPVVFYHTRRDFEQSTVIEGPIPESLGGLTEVFSWKRVTFPFEGDLSGLEHVAKHESTHIYHIAAGVRRLPLWFIEGSAETNSIKWDADAEMLVRDAYVNGFFLRIEDFWRIEGTWLMYKLGNFITNLLWDRYGEEGFRKIFERASSMGFEDNLKESLGLTVKELDDAVAAELNRRYGALLSANDILDTAKELRKGRVLLSARDSFFLTGGRSGPRLALYLNHLGEDGRLTQKRVVTDRRFQNESLGNFRKGASIGTDALVYVMKRGPSDVIRVVPFSFDQERRRFTLGETKEFGWHAIDSITDPVSVGDNRVAFVGYEGGFSNLYLFDSSTGELRRLTNGTAHHSGLDYSPARNELLFSREEPRRIRRALYDRNLYTLNLETQGLTQITDTPELREIDPSFSPSGDEIVYVADPEGTHDLMIYRFDTNESRRLAKLKIGARRPHFGPSGSLLLNGFKETESIVYQASFPGPERAIHAELAWGEPAEVGIADGAVLLRPKTEPEAAAPRLREPREGDILRVEDGHVVLKVQDRTYTALTVARFADRLLWQAELGLPGSKRYEGPGGQQYFETAGHDLRVLRGETVAREGIPDSMRGRFEERLSGRAIIQAWTDPEGEGALLVVNNRLAHRSRDFRDRPEVSVIRAWTLRDEVEELPPGPIRAIDDHVAWAAFLSDKGILLAVGPERFGPFDLHVFDRKIGKWEVLAASAETFRVSPSRDRIAWRRGKDFRLWSVGEVQPTRLRGIPASRDVSRAFDFLDDGTLVVFGAQDDEWTVTTYGEGRDPKGSRAIAHDKGEKVEGAAVDGSSGDVALRVRRRQKTGPLEKLLVLESSTGKVTDVSGAGARFSELAYRAGYLTFTEYSGVANEKRAVVWRPEERVETDTLRLCARLDDGALLIEGERQLTLYEPSDRRNLFIGSATAGHAMNGSTIVFSSKEDRFFRLFLYDRLTGERSALTEDDADAVRPAVADGTLLWSAWEGSRWEIRQAPLDDPSPGEAISLAGYDLTDAVAEDGKVTAKAFSRPDPLPFDVVPEVSEPFRGRLDRERVPQTFKLQSLAGAVAYDGDSFRFFVSAFADNLLSDRGLFANAMFLGGSRYAMGGFSDIRTGMSYSAFFNSRDEVNQAGTTVAKRWIFDRYREITTFAEFERQSYGLATIDTLSFVTPETESRAFYILRTGAAYAYDVTIWDTHGPAAGSRFLLRGETGVDSVNGRLANADVNLDFRVYHRFLPRFGLAHRLAAGTSQGSLPSVFLAGGNLSFRGLGFDGLSGQNYVIFSEDLRVPVFDFLGAKFFDPADAFIGFLTRFFDVRGGLYLDMGSVWFNDETPDLRYSFGWFFNAPTLFGINFRFNKGLLGEKGMNIWAGVNW